MSTLAEYRFHRFADWPETPCAMQAGGHARCRPAGRPRRGRCHLVGQCIAQCCTAKLPRPVSASVSASPLPGSLAARLEQRRYLSPSLIQGAGRAGRAVEARGANCDAATPLARGRERAAVVESESRGLASPRGDTAPRRSVWAIRKAYLVSSHVTDTSFMWRSVCSYVLVARIRRRVQQTGLRPAPLTHDARGCQARIARMPSLQSPRRRPVRSRRQTADGLTPARKVEWRTLLASQASRRP